MVTGRGLLGLGILVPFDLKPQQILESKNIPAFGGIPLELTHPGFSLTLCPAIIHQGFWRLIT